MIECPKCHNSDDWSVEEYDYGVDQDTGCQDSGLLFTCRRYGYSGGERDFFNFDSQFPKGEK